MNNLKDWLTIRLRALQPEKLCVLDNEADDFAATTLPNSARFRFDHATPACDLALGLGGFAGLDAPSAQHLIHRVRLFAAPHVLLRAHPACVLDEAALRALGFEREVIDPESGTRIHSYNLATYKPAPDWLNARFWAHPERWEP